MDFVSIFKSLGDETRLRMLNLFIQSNERICVCEMVDALKLPQYTISKALGILRIAGLTVAGKQGTWVYNQLNTESEFLISFFNLLRQHLSDQYPEDIKRLNKRLALRKENVCVIGVPLKDKLDKEFQKQTTCQS